MSVLRNFNLNLLVVFDAIMTHRNLTRAAEALYLSQPAVSHSLRRLRESFGDELFLKTPQGLAPTDLADQIGAEVRQILSQVENTISVNLDFDPSTSKEHFNLAALDYISHQLVPRLMRRLDDEAPGVTVQISSIAQGVIRDRSPFFEEDKPQLLIGTQKEYERTIEHRLLFKEHVICVSDKDNSLIGTELTLENYIELGHVVNSKASQPGIVRDALEKLGVSRRRALVQPYLTEVPYILKGSRLIASVPGSMRPYLQRFPWLRFHELPFRVEPFPVSLVWHRRHSANKAHRWFRSIIESMFCA